MSAAFTGPSARPGDRTLPRRHGLVRRGQRKGGVHGRKIVLQAYDDGYNPDPAIENTVRLIEKDDAFVLFGYVGTPTVTRVLPLLKRYSDQYVYLFCPFTGAEPHAPAALRRIRLQPPRLLPTRRPAAWWITSSRSAASKIAVFYQIDAYGRGGWDGVRTALKPRTTSHRPARPPTAAARRSTRRA